MTKSIFMTIVFLGYLVSTYFIPSAYQPTIVIVLGALLAGNTFLDYNKKEDYSKIFEDQLKDLEETNIKNIQMLEQKMSTINAGLISSQSVASTPTSPLTEKQIKVWGL